MVRYMRRSSSTEEERHNNLKGRCFFLVIFSDRPERLVLRRDSIEGVSAKMLELRVDFLKDSVFC